VQALELSCVLIVVLYVVVRLLRRPAGGSWAWLAGLAWLSCASALGEDSLIRLYGFYEYAANYSLYVDRVPLLIVLIWPIVIDSAQGLAAGLCRALGRAPTGRWLAGLTAAVVWVDAWLIEPIASQCGLWRWHAPGLFAVPPIGVLGWALFTGLSVAAYRAWLAEPPSLRWLFRAVAVAALVIAATHFGLILAWWGLLRPLSTPIPTQLGIALAWLSLLPLAGLFLRHRVGRHIPLADLLVRVPAAGFFFVLLAVRGAELATQRGPLLLYALAFAVPYWVLVLARRPPPPKTETSPAPAL
jgi:hypothetical protein